MVRITTVRTHYANGDMPEPQTITFYYPAMHELRADGTIVMRATGHEGGWRWTGERSFSPDASDYDFWRWVIAQRERWSATQFFSGEELPSIQHEYANRVA